MISPIILRSVSCISFMPASRLSLSPGAACDFGRQVAGGDAASDFLRVLRVAAERADNVAANQEQRQRDESADADTPGEELRRLLAEQRVDVIDVDAAADHPTHGRETLDVGELGRRRFLPRFRPQVVDEAGTLFLDHLVERDEEQLARSCPSTDSDSFRPAPV